jgi:YbbR domain-containing protein
MNKLRVKINHPGLKLLALVLAFMAWQAVRENTRFESMVESVPVRVEVPAGWAVLEKSTDHVSVLFRGSREDVRDLSRDQLEVRVVISEEDILTGAQTLHLHERNVQTTSAARPVFIKPAELQVWFDHAAERTVPVKAQLKGSLPDGLSVARRTCDPAAVRISGPQQRISQIQYLWTEPVELDGRNESFKERVKVALPSRRWYARLEPEFVNVEVVMAGQVTSRKFERVPIRLLTESAAGLDYRVEPEFVTVELTGSREQLDQLRDRDVYAFVDCAGFKEKAEYQASVQINLTTGLRAGRVDPESVKVVAE